MELDKHKFFLIEHCKGLDDCSNAVINGTSLLQKLNHEINEYNFPQSLTDIKLLSHQRFRISLSLCPNGCSRPQIADFGLISATVPQITDIPCTGCNNCVNACLEEAITIDQSNTPILDLKKCLYCAQCVRDCPTGSLRKGKTGFRVLLGGKLGRHPQLGQDLGYIYNADETIELLQVSINHFIDHIESGMRFGDIINKTGMDWMHQYLKIPKRS